jgi:hypothetical protein
MSNAVITPTVIAKEALMQLENNMVMGNQVFRDYKKEFVKVGDTVNVRMPVDFTVTDGATRSNQDVVEKNSNVVINSRKHVSWKFTTQDLTLTIEEYSDRYVKPAMIRLANQVDADLCALYKKIYFTAGAAGTTPATFAAIAAAAQKMDEVGVPDDGQRRLVLNPAARWALADGLKGVYNSKRVEDFIGKGYLGSIAEFDILGDQNIISHVKGTATGTPLVNGAAQNVTYASLTSGSSFWQSSLITDGWTNSLTPALKAGDVFTIASVFAVNPINKTSTGQLQEFTVISDANSDGAGNSTITVSPPIISSGVFQTVSAAPADNAAITVKASHAANLAFHKNAFALVMCPLELPDGCAYKARESYNGMSVRVVKDYDIDADEEIIRLDILYGTKAVDPRLAVRLLG